MAFHEYRQTLDEIRGDRDWTGAEQRLLDQAHTGYVIFGDTIPDPGDDASVIRAALLRHIVLGGCKTCRVPRVGVSIKGARIKGLLDLEGCKSPADLRLSSCHLDTQPILQDAQLGGVYLPGCHLPKGLTAHRLQTKRDVLLKNGFRADAPVDLSRATVGGQLACVGGHFDGAGDVALDGDALKVGADVFLSNGFAATGQVNLTGARIGGQLSCIGGRFDGAGGVALSGEALKVGADVFLRDGFVATGQVNLTGARIGGQLSCIGGRFDGAGGVALSGEALKVGADVFLRDGFVATGRVALVRASIAGNLRCHGGRFKGGLDLEGATIGGGLFWRDVAKLSGPVDLTDAHVGRLEDDAGSWEGAEPLILSGFRYDRLSGDMTVQQRLDWLGRKHERPLDWPLLTKFPPDDPRRLPLPDWLAGGGGGQVDPQPYTQLATVYRQQGMLQAASRVLEIRERRVRRAGHRERLRFSDGSIQGGLRSLLALPLQLRDLLFGAVVGYGHRPARALGWLALFWLYGFLLFSKAYDTRQMAPNSDIVLTSADWNAAVEAGCPTTAMAQRFNLPEGCKMPLAIWLDRSAAAPDYETFSPALYALDLFIPLDALGQEAAWAPSKDRGIWGWLGYWSRMPVQLAGWIITAVGAAALAGLIGRRD